ncbi:MAG: hypothetical protein Q7T17_04010 [Microbacterium sp.]|uniref:hypothetical protein n=1 Tax=Microbacterium sp. TaxID=51671 RepID=UPI002719A4C7|nr:hypothetical protein [Microbacterium sp.]MDO8382123.1 hypothetical protein [Microbacterium sp.]
MSTAVRMVRVRSGVTAATARVAASVAESAFTGNPADGRTRTIARRRPTVVVTWSRETPVLRAAAREMPPAITSSSITKTARSSLSSRRARPPGASAKTIDQIPRTARAAMAVMLQGVPA